MCRNSEICSSLPPALGYIAAVRLSSLWLFGSEEEDEGEEEEEESASSVRLMSSDSGMVKSSSSWISLAAAPANVPESSTIPAGSSGKRSDPAGTRGWRVRRTCRSLVEVEGMSSGWRIICWVHEF